MKTVDLQKHTSKNASINSKKLPAIYTNKFAKDMMIGKKVIDIGGGKFDNAVPYVKELGGSLSIYDKYNRCATHNKIVLKDNYDVAVCSNVLNVIDSRIERLKVIELCASKASTLLFKMYEGDGTGIAKESKKDCWQENRKTSTYIPEIAFALGEHWKVSKHGDIICCEHE